MYNISISTYLKENIHSILYINVKIYNIINMFNIRTLEVGNINIYKYIRVKYLILFNKGI